MIEKMILELAAQLTNRLVQQAENFKQFIALQDPCMESERL
jgi:hypothetical protein